MNVSDTRGCAFEAFITNLGKYNEGFLVGEWVKFPVTNEEMQAVFRRIGIGRRYEEWFITDYRRLVLRNAPTASAMRFSAAWERGFLL